MFRRRRYYITTTLLLLRRVCRTYMDTLSNALDFALVLFGSMLRYLTRYLPTRMVNIDNIRTRSKLVRKTFTVDKVSSSILLEWFHTYTVMCCFLSWIILYNRCCILELCNIQSGFCNLSPRRDFWKWSLHVLHAAAPETRAAASRKGQIWRRALECAKERGPVVACRWCSRHAYSSRSGAVFVWRQRRALLVHPALHRSWTLDASRPQRRRAANDRRATRVTCDLSFNWVTLITLTDLETLTILKQILDMIWHFH